MVYEKIHCNWYFVSVFLWNLYEVKKLKKAENIAEELTKTAKCDAQEHSNELWKHNTAFIELVSNQRQLQPEMSTN